MWKQATYYKRHRGQLSLSIYSELVKVFLANNWTVPSLIFEGYIGTLSKLNLDGQKLILDLTKRFKYVYGVEYREYLESLLKQIVTKYSGNHKIFITRDFQCYEKAKTTIKSSDSVYYKIEGVAPLISSNLTLVQNIDKLERNIKDKDVLVIVDDFVGTGSTIMQSVHDYMAYLNLPINQIAVLTIAIMSEGLKVLQSKGVNTFYSICMDKGISDYYEGSHLEKKTVVMHQIEDNIPNLKPEYRFGYHQSEALICMERCPNNTFPIYWLQKDSPYPRSYDKI